MFKPNPNNYAKVFVCNLETNLDQIINVSELIKYIDKKLYVYEYIPDNINFHLLHHSLDGYLKISTPQEYHKVQLDYSRNCCDGIEDTIVTNFVLNGFQINKKVTKYNDATFTLYRLEPIEEKEEKAFVCKPNINNYPKVFILDLTTNEVCIGDVAELTNLKHDYDKIYEYISDYKDTYIIQIDDDSLSDLKVVTSQEDYKKYLQKYENKCIEHEKKITITGQFSNKIYFKKEVTKYSEITFTLYHIQPNRHKKDNIVFVPAIDVSLVKAYFYSGELEKLQQIDFTQYTQKQRIELCNEIQWVLQRKTETTAIDTLLFKCYKHISTMATKELTWETEKLIIYAEPIVINSMMYHKIFNKCFKEYYVLSKQEIATNHIRREGLRFAYFNDVTDTVIPDTDMALVEFAVPFAKYCCENGDLDLLKVLPFSRMSLTTMETLIRDAKNVLTYYKSYDKCYIDTEEKINNIENCCRHIINQFGENHYWETPEYIIYKRCIKYYGQSQCSCVHMCLDKKANKYVAYSNVDTKQILEKANLQFHSENKGLPNFSSAPFKK